jgi:SAM-dependent methyltransferase
VIDALTSSTLKHLREDWWDDDFTEFLAETLKPRPGNRILDLGCGEGLAEVSIGRLHISQIRLVGIDLVPAKVAAARQAIAAHNQRAAFAAGDACRLPFIDAAFDSIFCVAVLQHIGDVNAALGEIARVARPRAKVVAVEPDNGARYFFSSAASGTRAFVAAGRLFAALAESRHGSSDPAIGPRLPGLFETHRIEPLDVRLFPVSHAQLGAPPVDVWADRRRVVDRVLQDVGDARVRASAGAYAEALRDYEAEATRAGGAFVEIQNTMLFATVGQKLG